MKTIALAGIIAIGIGLTSHAEAQYSKPLGLSVRAGLFLTGDGDARDREGRNWFAIGVEYKLRDLKFGKAGDNSSYSISLDYYGKGNYGNMPILFNYIGRNQAFYYSAGVGLGFARVPDAGGSSDTTTEFAYQLSFGYDFNKMSTPFFAELRFYGSNETQLNGFGLLGGVRF